VQRIILELHQLETLGQLGIPQVSTVTEQNIETYEDNGGASMQFGYTGQNKKQWTLGAMKSSNQCIGKAIQIKQSHNYDQQAWAEIKTRADTICAGSTFILHVSTGKIIDVSGFHDSLETISNIPVGTCITALDLTNETIIASFQQSLYFGDSMEHSLIPPTQLWEHGLTVNVVPKTI
jgi:hypothetical protein